MAKKSTTTYQELSEELEGIIAALHRDDTDIDTAVAQYKKGLTVINDLQRQLTSAENTITELTAAFNKS